MSRSGVKDISENFPSVTDLVNKSGPVFVGVISFCCFLLTCNFQTPPPAELQDPLLTSHYFFGVFFFFFVGSSPLLHLYSAVVSSNTKP